MRGRLVLLLLVNLSALGCVGQAPPRPEHQRGQRQEGDVKDAPLSCGTLRLGTRPTRHCFPPGASRHHVCCVDIRLPEGGRQEAGNATESWNILERRIRESSSPASFSWCTCSSQICTNQLGGRVAWTLEPSGSLTYPFASASTLQAQAAAKETQDALALAANGDWLHGGPHGISNANEMFTEEADRMEDDDVEEIDLQEKLAPLSREQLEELVAGLVARDEGLGDTVLRLAKKQVDTTLMQHQVQALQKSRSTAEKYTEELEPIARQACLYGKCGDKRNAIGIAEALGEALIDYLPATDPDQVLLRVLTLLEQAFESAVPKVKKRSERSRIAQLLAAWQKRLTNQYGPIFSDALRILSNIEAQRKRDLSGSGGQGRVGANKEGFFKSNRLNKQPARGRNAKRK